VSSPFRLEVNRRLSLLTHQSLHWVVVPMLHNQIISGHGHVGERRIQRGMPEQLLQAERVPTSSHVGNRKGMAELVQGDWDPYSIPSVLQVG
jgi:hypothetical protein